MLVFGGVTWIVVSQLFPVFRYSKRSWKPNQQPYPDKMGATKNIPSNHVPSAKCAAGKPERVACLILDARVYSVNLFSWKRAMHSSEKATYNVFQEEHLVNHGDQVHPNESNTATKHILGGCFKYFLFSPVFGEMTQFDSYFSDGLKPSTRYFWSTNEKSSQDHPTTLGSNWSLHHVFLSCWSSPSRLQGVPTVAWCDTTSDFLLVEMLFFLLQCFYRHQK